MAVQARKLMFLVGAYYFLQDMGGNPGLHSQALSKTAKEVWNYSPVESAAFFAFLTIPWMIKPLYGLVSDFLPIFGSKRKSYFLLTAILAGLSYAVIAWAGFSDETVKLLLFNAAIGIAFSDVLCDAVMVERGQKLGIIAKLQSSQWFALGAAGVLIAFVKGYIAEFYTLAEAVRLSLVAPFLIVALTLFFLREEKMRSSGQAAREAWQGVKNAVRLKPLWAVAIFIFLFQMSPNFGAVMYYYEKDVLKFSDILIGQIDTVGSIGFVFGAFVFGVISRRISGEKMLKAIIISGVVSALAYLFFVNAASAFVVSAFAGIVAVVAFLGVLNIAAEVCPKNAEGTVFALLMSVSNFGSQLGMMSGGKLYEMIGYSWLVVISASATACMWFFLPLVRKR